jgi:chemotaxis protein MotA
MDLATIIGLAVAAIGILGGYTLEGGSITGLFNIPGLMIVVVGTMGATMVAFPLSHVLAAPKIAMAAFFSKVSVHADHMSKQLVTMADKARREGLLSLEDEAQAIDDTFAKKGLMLMIDGTDPDALRSIMEIDIDALSARHRENARLFEAAGGFSPTLGVLGAVMGLITVLSNLAEPEELGHGIAVAFVATFYGVGLANVLLLPLAEKLKVRSQEERLVREMILEGILAIQSGDNPRIVREKLESFLSPAQRGGDGEEEEARAA